MVSILEKYDSMILTNKNNAKKRHELIVLNSDICDLKYEMNDLKWELVSKTKKLRALKNKEIILESKVKLLVDFDIELFKKNNKNIE